MRLQVDKEKLGKICNENGIEYLALFGSHARGEEKKDSDIDLLVRFFNRKISLLDHVEIEDKLGSFFGKKVDLVSERALHPYIRPYVVKDLVTLYERR